MPTASVQPYCGPPAHPATIGGSWNLDPRLLGALALVAFAYGLAARRHGGTVRRGERSAFVAGWSLLVLAFVSPLCSLGVALFAARLGQHLLLTLAAAPLLVYGCRPLWRARPRARATAAAAAVAPGLAFTLALWLWHLPGPYDATFADSRLYWLMHLSLLASACWLWAAILRREAGTVVAAGLLALGSALPMGLLGALLVFASRPLYASHLATASRWGLSPLADQALGGLLCWIPGCLVLAVAGVQALVSGLLGAEGASPLGTPTLRPPPTPTAAR